MTKTRTIKLSALLLLTAVMTIAAAIFLVTENPVKADEVQYILKFYDTDNMTVLKTMTGSADTVITEEMLNFTLPQKQDATFSGWGAYGGADVGEEIVLKGKTFEDAYGNRFNIDDTSGTMPLYPIFWNHNISIEFIDETTTSSLGILTKRYDEKVTKAELDALLGKQGYTYRIIKDLVDTEPVNLIGYTMKEIRYDKLKRFDYIVIYEEIFTLVFYDTDESTVLKTITGTGETLVTREMLDFELPKKDGYIFEKWVFKDETEGYLGNIKEEMGYTLQDIYERSPVQVSEIKLYPSFETDSNISFFFHETELFKEDKFLTKKKSERITQRELDALLNKDGYSYIITDTTATPQRIDLTVYARAKDIQNTDYYVVYTPLPEYTIKIIADGRVKITATAEKGKTMDLGGAGITSIMTKDGYTLKGYATAEDGEIVYDADAVITPESDLTLYAVYEEIKAPNDDETDKPGEQDKQNKKTVNVTGIMVSIPLLALLAAGTVYLVGKIKKS